VQQLLPPITRWLLLTVGAIGRCWPLVEVFGNELLCATATTADYTLQNAGAVAGRWVRVQRGKRVVLSAKQ
jgi:hypothetical protein